LNGRLVLLDWTAVREVKEGQEGGQKDKGGTRRIDIREGRKEGTEAR
jgi:hypothetical protein